MILNISDLISVYCVVEQKHLVFTDWRFFIPQSTLKRFKPTFQNRRLLQHFNKEVYTQLVIIQTT